MNGFVPGIVSCSGYSAIPAVPGTQPAIQSFIRHFLSTYYVLVPGNVEENVAETATPGRSQCNDPVSKGPEPAQASAGA